MARVEIPSETLERLHGIARATGRDADSLAAEALAAYADDEEAFIAAVEEGKAQAARGELVSHDEVFARLEAKQAARERRPQ